MKKMFSAMNTSSASAVTGAEVYAACPAQENCAVMLMGTALAVSIFLFVLDLHPVLLGGIIGILLLGLRISRLLVSNATFRLLCKSY